MIGERLKQARKKAGFSLRSLSAAMDGAVSAQAIGKYERNEMMPSSKILSRLAHTLDVSLDYLFSEQVQDLDDVQFRKAPGMTDRERARIHAAVIDHLQRYIAIEEIIGMDSHVWKSPKNENRFLGKVDDGEELAQDIRKEWKLGIDPIPNMTALLEDRGIKVLVLSLPDGISGLTALARRPKGKRAVPVITVNRDMSLERRRITLAHELAHRLIDPVSPVDHEKAANLFAGAFLVPQEHLIRELGKNRDALGYREVIYLKRIYRISAAALLVRLRQAGIISQSVLKHSLQTFAREWHADEPEPLEPEGEKGQHETPSRFDRLCYWALAEQLISVAKAGELLRQPLTDIERELKGPDRTDADRGE